MAGTAVVATHPSEAVTARLAAPITRVASVLLAVSTMAGCDRKDARRGERREVFLPTETSKGVCTELNEDERKLLEAMPLKRAEAATFMWAGAENSMPLRWNWGKIAAKAMRSRDTYEKGLLVARTILDDPTWADPGMIVPLLRAPDKEIRVIAFEWLAVAHAEECRRALRDACQREEDAVTRRKMRKYMEAYVEQPSPLGPLGVPGH